MRKIRVLIVDDSVVIRRLLSNLLSEDPMIEVVGVAANGKIALQKLPLVKPDIVTLDIEMPVMNGLETVKAIRKQDRKVPIVMFSTLTERGAVATLDALSYGANDYVTKPSNVGSIMLSMQRVREELVPKIKALCDAEPLFVRRNPVVPKRKQAIGASHRTPSRSKRSSRIDVVAIGTSTGGPNALKTVFAQLPASLSVPIVVVQHMPPLFTKYLANSLDSKSPVRVDEGQEGLRLQPGHAWIAPGDYHMVVKRKGADVVLGLNQAAPENSCRPAVDVLFRSVADVYGGNVLGVVMTGMGHDGLVGAEAIRDAGGTVLIQDQASSVIWGMPGSVARADLADDTLPLESIASAIVERVGRRSTPVTRPASLVLT